MLSLPPELLSTTFDHLRQANFPARISCCSDITLLPASYRLRHVTSVCRLFRDICRPLIFEWVHLDGSRISKGARARSIAKKVETFLEALGNDAEIQRFVKRLGVKAWFCFRGTAEGFDDIERIFLKLPRVRELFVSSSPVTEEMFRHIARSSTMKDVTFNDVHTPRPPNASLVLPNLKCLSHSKLYTKSNMITLSSPNLDSLTLSTSDIHSFAGPAPLSIRQLTLQGSEHVAGLTQDQIVSFLGRCPDLEALSTQLLPNVPTSFLPKLKTVKGPPHLITTICAGRPVETVRIKTPRTWIFRRETLHAEAFKLRALHLYFVPWKTDLLRDVAEACPLLEVLEVVAISTRHGLATCEIDEHYSPVPPDPWEQRRSTAGLITRSSTSQMAQLRSFTLLQKGTYDGEFVTGVWQIGAEELERRRSIEMREVKQLAESCPKLNEARFNTSLYWKRLVGDKDWAWHEWDYLYESYW